MICFVLEELISHRSSWRVIANAISNGSIFREILVFCFVPTRAVMIAITHNGFRESAYQKNPLYNVRASGELLSHSFVAPSLQVGA